MNHRLAHCVGRSSQATPAAVDKSASRLTHKKPDAPDSAKNPPLKMLHHYIDNYDELKAIILNHVKSAASLPWDRKLPRPVDGFKVELDWGC